MENLDLYSLSVITGESFVVLSSKYIYFHLSSWA